MIVVDASAMVEVLLDMPEAATTERAVFGSGRPLHAPHLLDLEVAQVVRRFHLRREIADERGEAALAVLALLSITRHDHGPLLPRVWELRHQMTAYDAAYVALAEALGAPLVTRDAKLAAARGHGAVIELV